MASFRYERERDARDVQRVNDRAKALGALARVHDTIVSTVYAESFAEQRAPEGVSLLPTRESLGFWTNQIPVSAFNYGVRPIEVPAVQEENTAS